MGGEGLDQGEESARKAIKMKRVRGKRKWVAGELTWKKIAVVAHSARRRLPTDGRLQSKEEAKQRRLAPLFPLYTPNG